MASETNPDVIAEIPLEKRDESTHTTQNKPHRNRSNKNITYSFDSKEFSVFKHIHPGDDYSEYGLSNLCELDILTRIGHPYIIHAHKITVSDGFTIMLPLADRSLVDIIQDRFMTTDMKLPIMYKLATGIEFLHRNNILHLDINPHNVVIQGIGINHPYLIEFGSTMIVDNIAIGKSATRSFENVYSCAPEIVAGSHIYTAAVDVWAFGILMLQVISGKYFLKPENQENFLHQQLQLFSDPNPLLDQLLNGIRPTYQVLLKNLLVRILKVDPTQRPSMEEICNDPLFEEIRNKVSVKSNVTQLDGSPNIEINYAADHRDILKLILHWAGLIYPQESAELLFLGVDLFNRTGNFFKDRSSDHRMVLAATCLWMAAKLTESQDIPLSTYTGTINKMVSNINSRMILDMELEIIQILNGILNISHIYRGCKTADEVNLSFANIIMARDSTTYTRIEMSKWKETMQSMITTPTHRDRNIPIAELLKL
jgi:serine/threonine protein kinase